jgi:hypothetical protein
VLKTVRSVSFSRNIIGGLFIGFLAIIVLGNLLLLAIALPEILKDTIGIENIVAFLNSNLLFFFLVEMLYRFFLQKLPVIELENFLHLPIKKSRIVHFLLCRSFGSPLSIIVIICFLPVTIMEVSASYGMLGATRWFCTILLISWSLHWLVLWYKQQWGDNLIGITAFFLLTFIAFSANYYGYLNLGSIAAPLFEWSLTSLLPVILAAAVLMLTYRLTYSFYRKHTYVEDLGEEQNIQFVNRSVDFFSQFGIAGEIADLEWKLILRHKKSRNYLLITFLFLLYGLFFYGNPDYTTQEGFSYFYIFLGIFITGIFLLQYGQLFLSWNSGSFDFYLARKDGLEALIKGKYLLFFVISLLCFLLSIPYVYFGWDILLVHFACFLFNMGVSIHIVVYLSLWKPKPMDLNKSALFNYEGMGIAQFLMGFPIIIFPYLIFIPIGLLIGDYFGLIVLGGLGAAGMIFYDRLSDISVSKLIKNRYQISSSFRQEL